VENKSFDEMAKDKTGTIYHDEMRDGIRFIVLRGPAALCAYAGIPLAHPLARFHYEDLAVDAHGGLTFSNAGDGKLRPKGFWWYGWDYGHCDDCAFYYLEYPELQSLANGKKWTVKEAVDDSWEALHDMAKLKKLAEQLGIVRRIKRTFKYYLGIAKRTIKSLYKRFKHKEVGNADK